MSDPYEPTSAIEVSDWLRANEEEIKVRMRFSWRDSIIITDDGFDALVMATVIECSEMLRTEFTVSE